MTSYCQTTPQKGVIRPGAVVASEEHARGGGCMADRECTVYSSHDTGWEPWFEDEGVPTTPATLSFRP